MVSLHSTTVSSAANSLSSPRKLRIASGVRSPGYLKNPLIVLPKLPKHEQKKLVLDQLSKLTTIPLMDNYSNPITITQDCKKNNNIIARKLYTILEVVEDRIEMHHNIMEQRSNWNSLLLNSLNMITLTAATMAGLSGSEIPILPLKVSSILLFSAATGVLLVMNKIQPSQLVEEQRNAVRLFNQLRNRIETSLSLETPTETHVHDAMEKVLALDRAYPLPLLGAMIDKFPKTFKPASWWPTKIKSSPHIKREKVNNNGWSEELEEEMREIVGVINNKDIEDYVRLGNKALKLNKLLAILGPLLMGTATIGSAFMGHGGPWAGLVVTVAGSMASVVNTIEHGGQVGMVYEMYRNCAGFFSLLEETVESTLEEVDFGRRENGELFELKMALRLGRSLSELRDLADESRINGGSVNGFASKLF